MHIHFKAYLRLKSKSGAQANFLKIQRNAFFKQSFVLLKKRGCRPLNKKGSSIMKKQKRKIGKKQNEKIVKEHFCIDLMSSF
jgi:succinate dehydrogenase/fumarate reductase flavoprotein subunit